MGVTNPLNISHTRYILVGNGSGKMAALDLRGGKLVNSFRDIAGSVRYIRCHPNEPLVVSCGLDRFLRVHHLHTKKLLRKVCTYVLVRSIPTTS